MRGIHDLALDSTPVTILDFETTGLSPKQGARVVEVAVARVEPKRRAQLAFDTLIDPEGPVHASSIHGIFDDDVLGAPRFTDIANQLLNELAGTVVLAYNAAFDLAFLHDELLRAIRPLHFPPEVPYACLMYLRPAIGLGDRCGLHAACQHARLAVPDHRAAHDALAAAELWATFRDHAVSRGAKTFGDLVPRKKYKFMQSWIHEPLTHARIARAAIRGDSIALKPRDSKVSYPDHGSVSARTASSTPDDPARSRLRERAPIVSAYRQALIDALSDAKVEPREVEQLIALKSTIGINPGEVRAVHAAVYAGFLDQCVEDQFVSHNESADISTLNAVLSELGWAPGDLSAPA